MNRGHQTFIHIIHRVILRHRSSGESVQFQDFDEDQIEIDPIADSIG